MRHLAFMMLVLAGAASLAASTTVGPPNGYLVIHGGGGGVLCLEKTAPPQCEEHLDEFVRLAGGENASIVIIPTAALFEDPPPPSVPLSWSMRPNQYDSCFQERYAAIFRSRGVQSIRFVHTKSRTEADEEAFTAPIAAATGVWLIGGRQWLLADAYLGTRTEQALHELLDRGGVIGGGSAAAAIQASYLARGDTRGNLNIIGDHEQGFGFMRNTAIDIHVLSWNRQFDLLSVVTRHPELLGIGIDADATIVVHGDEFRVIGVGSVAIYDPKIVAANGRFYFLERSERFDLATRTAMHASGKRLRLPQLLPPHVPAAESLARLAGEYEFDDKTVAVSVRGMLLVAELAPGDERELIPIEEDVFFDSITGHEVAFHRNRAGEGVELEWKWSRCLMVAKRK